MIKSLQIFESQIFIKAPYLRILSPGSSVGRARGCGTEFEVNKETRTYGDRRKYFIEAVAKRRKKIRLQAVAYLGGKCMKCGYNKYIEVLEFHHGDPTQKDFNVSRKGHCRSWERVCKEIEKCDLLCANCHREVHAEQNKVAAFTGNCGMKSE